MADTLRRRAVGGCHQTLFADEISQIWMRELSPTAKIEIKGCTDLML